MSDHIYSAAWLLGVWTGPTFHLSSLAVSTFTAPPRLPRGGILGDEMGMGKTMVMLAVMLVNEMPLEERWKKLKTHGKKEAFPWPRWICRYCRPTTSVEKMQALATVPAFAIWQQGRCADSVSLCRWLQVAGDLVNYWLPG